MKALLEAPNGSTVRAAHITCVSPLFQCVELGTDAFAVYVVGNEEPFVFAAPYEGDGARQAATRKRRTKEAHQQFLLSWGRSIEGDILPFGKN